MSAALYAVQGNLAFQHVDEPSRSFTVIDGVSSPRHHAPRIVVPAAPRVAPEASLARRVVCVVALIVLVTIVLAAGWTASAGRVQVRDAAIASAAFETIEVEAGDSLWTLAADHGIDGLSTQETSDVIRERNGLDVALLQPGMELQVPLA